MIHHFRQCGPQIWGARGISELAVTSTNEGHPGVIYSRHGSHLRIRGRMAAVEHVNDISTLTKQQL